MLYLLKKMNTFFLFRTAQILRLNELKNHSTCLPNVCYSFSPTLPLTIKHLKSPLAPLQKKIYKVRRISMCVNFNILNRVQFLWKVNSLMLFTISISDEINSSVQLVILLVWPVRIGLTSQINPL